MCFFLMFLIENVVKLLYIQYMVFSNFVFELLSSKQSRLNCACSVKQVYRSESVNPHLSAAWLWKKGTMHFALCSVSMHCMLLVLKLNSSPF